MTEGETQSPSEMLFIQVVSMFQVAALQHMGKLPNPVTNTIDRDLEQAKISVDILVMLKEKTQGNLRDYEREFLDKAVFESQMNYLEELKKPAEKAPDTTDTAEGRARKEQTETKETAEGGEAADEADKE